MTLDLVGSCVVAILGSGASSAALVWRKPFSESMKVPDKKHHMKVEHG